MPVNDLDMLLVHRVFRRELDDLAWLIARVQPGDNSRARVVGSHLRFMTEALHHHHAAEDELVWPIVSVRALDRKSDIERMQAQHGQIATALEEVQAARVAWTKFVQRSTTARMREAFAQLSELVLAHLDEEERDALPVIVEYLTPTEWGTAVKRGASFLTKHPRWGVVLGGLVLDYATPEEGRSLLGGVPLPQRFLVKSLGPRSLAAYRRKLYDV
ncbi:hemerythrin domain-containing protein [Mycobacterium sp. NPDC051198]